MVLRHRARNDNGNNSDGGVVVVQEEAVNNSSLLRRISGNILLVGIILYSMFRGSEELPTISSLSTTTKNAIQTSSPAAWTSSHRIDCQKMVKDLENETDSGMFTEVNITTPSFFMNIHDPTKDQVSNEIYTKGCWECSHLKGMLQALSQYPNSYFLDIGGNIGMWTITAAMSNHLTFTIEALSDNVERICKSIERNSLYNLTNLMHVAATSEPQTFRFNVPAGNIGGTSVIATTSTENNITSPPEKESDHDIKVVNGVTISSLKLPLDKPVVIKIDVEGHELQALLGAIDFLRDASIVYVMSELRSSLHSDARWNEIFDIFTMKGLKPYRINYEDETHLNVNDLTQWKHLKHPRVLYFDVAWRLDDFVV